jgi:hypothetical protein
MGLTICNEFEHGHFGLALRGDADHRGLAIVALPFDVRGPGT